MIRELISLRQDAGKKIVASSYGNTLGVPALFSRRFFHDLLSLEDGAGAKRIILRNRECVAEFLFPEGSIDIDSWSDYQRATNGA
jgi:molybdenum cofactor cytidylyltransferase